MGKKIYPKLFFQQFFSFGLEYQCGDWSYLVNKPVHIRRCHVCNGISEVSEGRVSTCDHCGKSLAPFYYFDDSDVTILSEDELREVVPENEYRPIYGLTVLWESY